MMSGSLWVEMTVLVQIHNIWRTDAFYMRCRFIFLTITHIARTGLWVAMHGTGLVMIITRIRRCLWNFMVKYGNFDIYLTLDCTNSGVQISLCLIYWGLVAQYLILSLAEMVNIGPGDGLFPVRYQVNTRTDIFRADWYMLYHWTR